MLKLKRVEIQGFKSFYDRTEMKFSGAGIAAVVGPNGCGKSNLSDAISWVLGEQSVKSLRGARMEDVIFAGTRAKKPLSMASVTMTLVPDETALGSLILSGPPVETEADSDRPPSEESEVTSPADEPSVATATDKPQNGFIPSVNLPKRGEITITRRLYRSGESEYLVNGKLARLRDIQDLFWGTGLGPESYAIIEQGRIGQILSNKPQDRRNVIEEAAGITKFKTRKRLAEAKLETAKGNLARVFDILEEVTRQANSLKRQAAKTKRFAELKEEKDQVLQQLLLKRFDVFEKESARLVIALNLASAEWTKATSAIEEADRSREQTAQEAYANDEQLTAARKEAAELRLEAERAQARLQYQAQQIQQIEARLTGGSEEAGRLEQSAGEYAAELEAGRQDLVRLGEEAEQARQLLQGKGAERQAKQQGLLAQERTLESSQSKLLRILGDQSARANRVTQMETHLVTFDRDHERLRKEEGQAGGDRERLQAVRKDLSARLAARQGELVSVADQRKTLEAELASGRFQVSEARQKVDHLRTELSRVRARRESLDEVIQHRSYSTETVKRLFREVERGSFGHFQPLGVLADFLEVDREYEKAAEEFLHDELEYVVVKSWAQADQGLELMRGDINGRATFLVEKLPNEDSTAHENAFATPPTDHARLRRLSEVLRLTNGLAANTPLSALPRIANCFVVSDRAYAQELAPQYPFHFFLTQDGASYWGQSVSGGKKTGAGPLALKRELREVSQSETARTSELAQAEAALAKAEAQVHSMSEHLDRLRVRMQSQEKEVLALDHEARKLGEDAQRVETRLSQARLELHRLQENRNNLEEQLQEQRDNLRAIQEAREEEEHLLTTARSAVRDLQGELALLTEQLGALRAQNASSEERVRSLSERDKRIERQLTDVQNRREHLRTEGAVLLSDRDSFGADNVQLEAAITRLGGNLTKSQAAVESLTLREGEWRSALFVLQENVKNLRVTAQRISDERATLQVSLARQESDLDHLRQMCQGELAISLQQLRENAALFPASALIAPSELEAQHDELRRKIDALGPVNPQALTEAEEAQTRLEFLLAQRQDLLDSIRDTEKAIAELDKEGRKRFLDAFEAINANFRVIFGTLFGGGTGEMRLSDEENASDSGIDLVASPPGKRLQSVLLLSGGEKSLTAMALLMAIFQYTPSPFCVLDEVDAPLDEPNIERLTRLIADMSGQTQFIVITHSKRTMEAAQSLYGVTMQEPGVSKLVSVKFAKGAEDVSMAGRRVRPQESEAPSEEQQQTQAATA